MRGKRNLYQCGEKFGKLTIKKRWTELRPNKKSKETVCECECECGKTVTVPARYIVSRHKLSCGCLQHLHNSKHHAWKGHGEIGLSTWNDIVRGCKRARTIPINLTIEQAWELFLKQNKRCALSGVPIQFSSRNRRYENEKHTASLDRIDSTSGYMPENVQWVHKAVQCMKWSLPQDEFIEWCKLIAANKSC